MHFPHFPHARHTAFSLCPPGIALSLYYLGAVNGQFGEWTEGVDCLTRAREMFQDYGDVLYHAKCLFWLEHVYYWGEKYDEALEAGEAAIQQYEDHGQYSGELVVLLGKILFMKGDYPEAFKLMVGALGTCKSYGSPRDIAEVLEIIGRIWAKMGQHDNALGAYAEAMLYHGAILHEKIRETGMARCRFLVRQAEDPSLVPNIEESEVLESQYNDFR